MRLLPALPLLLLLGSVARADTLYAAQGGRAFAYDVMVVEEKDGKVYYIDKSLKTRSFPKAMVGRVQRSKCDVHVYFERYDAAADAGAVMALAAWCTEKKFRPEVVTALHERALELDPEHEGANAALGRVKHGGRWMTPAEREAAIVSAQEEEMRAKGLVRWKDEWVTPADKEKLEKGLRKHDGKWMTEEEIKASEGLVQHNGQWIPKADLAIAKLVDRAKRETGLGEVLRFAQSDNYAVFGDLEAAQLDDLLKTMERLQAEFVRILPSARDSRILDGKHQLYVFRKADPYKTFVRARFERQKREEGWSESFARQEEERVKARVRETSFWEFQPTPVSAHVQMPDPFEGLRAHCVHFGANILVTRYNRERFTTWWLNESIAYYLEKRVTGTIQTFSVDLGGEKYAAQTPEEAAKNPWLDATKWEGLLGQAVRAGRDPRLNQIKSKDLYTAGNKLTAEDLAKGLSVVTFLLQDDARKFADFLDDVKTGTPRDEVEREVSAMIKHYGSYDQVEERWKQYALNGFRMR
jgi:hypothetical protein